MPFYSYRATDPDDLVMLQTREWDPVIKWFNSRSVPLTCVTGKINLYMLLCKHKQEYVVLVHSSTNN